MKTTNKKNRKQVDDYKAEILKKSGIGTDKALKNIKPSGL